MKSDGFNLKRRTFLKAALATGAAVGAGLPVPRFASAAHEIVEDAEKEYIPIAVYAVPTAQ
jgi:anaerobic selenocysteine-containing dehydrogenase